MTTSYGTGPSIQDRFFADAPCFGCGPGNAKGLRLKSFEAPDGQAWRGVAWLDAAAGTIEFFNAESVSSIADCQREGLTVLTGVIPIVRNESSVDAEGGLHIEFEDPKADPSWIVGRPEMHIDRARTFVAHAMELDLTPDGMMTAIFEVTDIWYSDGGIAQRESGTFRIEGPVTVSCDPGQATGSVTVASGGEAHIRCADTYPAIDCDDTTETSVSASACSITRLPARR